MKHVALMVAVGLIFCGFTGNLLAEETLIKHLGLWEVKPRPVPKATGPPKTPEYTIDYSVSQLPVSDKWFYADPQYPEAFPS